jgi:AcrR family transcriptional regulator
MGRKAGSSGLKTAAAIRQAGLILIFKHGYEAMSLRELAAETDLRPSSLYNHIHNKQDLLFDLVKTHMEELLAALAETLKSSGSAIERLKVFVDFHVTYHVERKHEVFISYSELRSLTPENYAVVVKMRKTYERVLIEVLKGGAKDGTFKVKDIKVTAYGILSMLSGVCTWFNPDGRLSKKQVSAVYSEMVINSVIKRE